jgi:hypothetical protein
MCWGGGGLPLTNNNPFQQQIHTTPYVFVYHNNSILPNFVIVHCIQKINDMFC